MRVPTIRARRRVMQHRFRVKSGLTEILTAASSGLVTLGEQTTVSNDLQVSRVLLTFPRPTVAFDRLFVNGHEPAVVDFRRVLLLLSGISHVRSCEKVDGDPNSLEMQPARALALNRDYPDDCSHAPATVAQLSIGRKRGRVGMERI